MMQSALNYLKDGLSVIPIGKNKKPLVSWQEYQNRLASEEEVKEWFGKWPDMNIGIVTGKLSGLTVVDFDTPDAIARFQSEYHGTTPLVKTPKGLHAYFTYTEGVRNATRIAEGTDIRSEGGYCVAPPSHGYKWLNNITMYLLDSLDSFDFIYRGLEDNKNGSVHNSPQSPQVSTDYFSLGQRDNSIYQVAQALTDGHCKRPLMEQTIEIIVKNCNPPFPEKEIPAKIQSALNRFERKERNLANEVRDWIESTNGHFLSAEVFNSLHLSTRQDSKNLSTIFSRLEREGIIKKYGSKNGQWEKVNQDIEIIDWMNATDEEYSVDLPLGLSSLVKLYPGNILICAGASNVGKTSLMLEIVRLNQRTHKVVYMNSEMGAQELRLRLSLFNEIIPLDKWNFKAIERSSNFVDVLEPDALNIIDFMEIHDEFWKIGGWIKEIHDKLKTGICIVAIQKKSGADFGRGGEITVEKPRLYLAMDRGVIKIVKAKIWRNHDRNPNGLTRKFSIINGWKFIAKYDWEDPNEGGMLA